MDMYLEVFIIISVLISACTCQSLSCSSECQCKFYPRRPIICTYSPGLTSFPGTIPNLAISVSMSGKLNIHNKLTQITKTNLANFKQLQHLTLDYSEISTIEDGAFSGTPALLELKLGYNQIQAITSKTFEGLTNMNVLDLTGNRHCRIETGAFTLLTKLNQLYLGEMSLETFPKSVSSLVSLEKLDLHGNEIKTLTSDVFSKLTKLQYLDISGNSIQTLLSSTENLIKRITTVELFDNPWHCNCQLQWMLALPRKYTNDIATGQSITCASPDKLRYRTLVDIPKTELECVPPKIVNCTKLSYDVHFRNPLLVKCLITGDPFPEVLWARPNGEKFVSGNVSAGLNISDKGYLNMQTASKLDNGVWTVKCVSDYGNDEKNIKITVIMPTTTTKSTSTTKPTSTSTSTNIHHKTTSNRLSTPPPKMDGSKVNPDVGENNQDSGDNGDHVKLNTAPSVSNPSSTESTKGETKPGGINMVLIGGAAGGGAFLLGLCGSLIYCLKRKKNKNKVQDIRPKKVKENFDSVKTPRQSKNSERPSRGSSMRRQPNQKQRPPGSHHGGGRRSVFRNDMALEALDF